MRTLAAQRSTLQALYATLAERPRPEDVAELVLDLLGPRLSARERELLNQAARRSLARLWHGYTSMARDFARPVGLARQVEVAMQLFPTAYPLGPGETTDVEALEGFVLHVGEAIHKGWGYNDYKHHRLCKELRRQAGLEISRRAYNKRFRLLARMETRLLKLAREQRKYQATRIGKSALATLLPWEAFAADEDTAAFIAYFAARCNLRSEFTIAGQQRAFDVIAEALLARCRASATTSWWAIAHVHPARAVLAHLSPQQQGELLGRWLGILHDTARLLEETWKASSFQLATMVVKPGDDSSTWNLAAGAWNRARDHWLALLDALGATNLLVGFCPGKVMRLMAADVVAWHRLTGGGLDPNTAVWAELPRPWDVLDGRAACPRARVIAACQRAGLDPFASGWAGPRPDARAVPFRATPELVHGVAVHSPHMAAWLRKHGWCSGKHRTVQTTEPTG